MALILVKYGVHHPIEKTKLECANEHDHVVLVQDGVFWAVTDEIQEVKGNICALREDFCARGYQEGSAHVSLIGYPELVDIIEKEEKMIG